MGPSVPGSGVELRARAGRAVLIDTYDASELDPARLRIPATLVDALHEWAAVVGRATDEPTGRMVSRRGRQLAMRLASETGGEVRYVDPLSGRVRRVSRQRAARFVAGGEAGTGVPGDSAAPVPWATGLTVGAIVAAIVIVALVTVSTGLAQVSVLLAVVVNIAVAAGFAPSIWIGRRVPVWRWVALGAVGGIVLAWCALLLGLLG